MRYSPGSGWCITRASVRAFNAARAERGEAAATPDEIVAAFKPALYHGNAGEQDKFLQRLRRRAVKVSSPPIREDVPLAAQGERIKKKLLGKAAR